MNVLPGQRNLTDSRTMPDLGLDARLDATPDSTAAPGSTGTGANPNSVSRQIPPETPSGLLVSAPGARETMLRPPRLDRAPAAARCAARVLPLPLPLLSCCECGLLTHTPARPSVRPPARSLLPAQQRQTTLAHVPLHIDSLVCPQEDPPTSLEHLSRSPSSPVPNSNLSRLA